MTVLGTYRNGVVVPNQALDLPEGATVRIDAEAAETTLVPGSIWERHALRLGGMPGADFDDPVPEMETPLFP